MNVRPHDPDWLRHGKLWEQIQFKPLQSNKMPLQIEMRCCKLQDDEDNLQRAKQINTVSGKTCFGFLQADWGRRKFEKGHASLHRLKENFHKVFAGFL